MATLNAGLPTLLDQMRRMDPDGSIAQIVEAVSKQSPVIEDAVFLEGNLPTGHKFTSRTALPSVAYRRFNEGVSPSKSKTDQVTETCAMMNGMSVVDVEEANLNGNAAAFRASEDSGFVQAMTIEAERGLIYNSTATAPEQYTGLLPRFDATTGVAGKQIVLHDGSASGNDQTSMLLVGWGPQSVFGIFPKGSKGGLSNKDMGEQLWDDGSGKKFRAYVTDWMWNLGLCVKDQRFVAAIRNIDVGNLQASGDTGNGLIKSAIKAYHKIYAPSMVRLAWYCNRDVATYLHLQALDSTKNSTLTIENVGGVPVTKLLGIPVRTTDAITSSEAAIS